jgi:hypothetical protein
MVNVINLAPFLTNRGGLNTSTPKKEVEKMHIPMIDTLCATIDITHFGNVDLEQSRDIDIIPYLEQQKSEAKAQNTLNMNYKHIIQIGSQSFQLLSNGSKGYAYILHNDSYEIKISQHRSSNENFYPVFIKIKQECLWSKGVKESWNIINEWITKNIGEIKANKVSRIDICCHTDELQLQDHDIETFSGRYHLDTIYRFKRKISTMCFGSGTTGKIICRIYDKTLEVTQKRQKLWFFDIWKSKGLDPDKVWNIEFEISRDFLKEVKLDSVEDTLDNLKTLWKYCTHSWLVKKQIDRTRMENCTTDDRWQSIQKAYDSFEGKGLVSREKQMETSAMALIPGTIGHITSFAARADITDINMLFEMIKSQGVKYLHNKDMDYEEAITEKMALLTN